MEDTGRGLADTGSTAKAFPGEEIDWYCCTVGAYHTKRAMDPSVGVTADQNSNVRRWLLGEDDVLIKAAAATVGMEGLDELIAHFSGRADWMCEAKVHAAAAVLINDPYNPEVDKHRKAVLALIDEHALATDEGAQQLELDALVSASNFGREPRKRQRIKELLANNPALKVKDLTAVAQALYGTPIFSAMGVNVRVSVS